MGNSSLLSLDDDGADRKPLKHRRGPGDEEDYETPVKNPGDKRVKWDRGLFSTICF